MTRVSIPVVLLLLAPAAAPDDVRPVALTLHPAAAPSPALKYPLLPDLADTIPGNAVTHYHRAAEMMKRDGLPRPEWYPDTPRWAAAPPKDFPREEVDKFLKPFGAALVEVEAGAHSEQCDWGLTEKLRRMGGSTPLPDVQEMRGAARLLQLRVRCELAEGRPVQALRTIRTGFALSRHVARQPTLASALVGVAIASLMATSLEELIQQPDAPNLYWSLADLPQPFIDLHEPFQGERVMAYGNFPGLAEAAADLNSGPWTLEETAKAANWQGFLKQEDLGPSPSDTLALALRVMARHGAAKKRLVAQGRPNELVDAMPPIQVALLDSFLLYDQLLDDETKWQSLPYWEALPAIEKASGRRVRAYIDDGGPAIPIAPLLLPPVQGAVTGRTRLDRRLAVLRTVEAIRLYAAGHDGKPPASLDEIKDAPLPLDPASGKAFEYRVVGERAFLGFAPVPGVKTDTLNTPAYEICIKR